MADNGTQLSAELTRIIECPYPASLSHLADLLARADILTIRACIHNRPPCAVARLATLVCEALPLWEYTLRILSSLCHSSEFRDSLLLHSPCLLDALLTKADSKLRDFDDYAGLCVLLLSRPLPASTPLPASAQAFFLRVFEKAVRSPDVSTLRPVYFMLNGACRTLLNVLPLERRRQFDEDLSLILSSNSAGQNQMLLLWCFGIALLAEYPNGVEGMNPPSSLERPATVDSAWPEKQWKTSSYRRLFGSASKLNKTIQMTYMSVIWATKGDVGVSDEDAIEGIRIAVRTLRVVDRAALQGWPKSSAIARNTVSKLADKVLRTDINPVIQLEALSFYATVAGEGNLPREVVTNYEWCLTGMANLIDADCHEETLSWSLQLFSPQLQQHSVQAVIAGALDACVSPPDTHRLSQWATMVEQMTAILPACVSLKATILSSVSSSEMHKKIWRFIHAGPGPESSTCCAYAVTLHQRMVTATIALLLNITLTVQSKEHAFPFAIATALIKKQGDFSRIQTQCSHGSTASQPSSISLFQQTSTSYTGQHLKDWRNRLKSELESQGHFQRDSIVRSVAQICQDLETRCDTVEGPLRHEKERSCDLERQVAELKARVASLEVEATDDRLHLEGLEDEKLNISDERDSLAVKLRDTEAEVREANRKAEDMLNKAHEDFNAKEMELRSAIITHEENLRAQEEEIEAQVEVVRNLRGDLETSQSQHIVLTEQHNTLQHRLEETEHRLSSESDTNRTKSEEIALLKNRNIELELHLQGTEAELDTVASRLSELQVSHQELIHSSEEAYKDLEMKYTSDLNGVLTKAREDTGKMDTQLREVIQRAEKAEEAHDQTRQDLQQVQTSIPPLEDRIQELNDFCSEQEEELVELRTMRRNLLAGLGVASQHPLAIRSARTQEDDTERTPRVPREHRRRKSAVQTLQAAPRATRSTQGITGTALENIANASFASSDSHSSQNGSTPKRAKPRSSFKAPSLQTPYTQKPVLSARSVSKKLSPSKRSALRQLSPNRRHTTVGFAGSENEEERADTLRSVRKRRGSLQGIEEAEFDMEDFLAGTPLTPGFAAGTGRIPEGDDETTTEL